MSVTQKSDGRWAVVHYVDGKQQWKYFGRGVEAEKAAREYAVSLKDTGQVREYKRRSSSIGPTVTELSDAYLKNKVSTMSAGSMQRLVDRLRGSILPVIGHRKAMRIDHSTLDEYVITRSRTVKSNTIRRELGIIRAILNFGVKRRYISYNNASGYVFGAQDEIIQPPTKAEIRALLDNAVPHLRRIIMLVCFLGIRPGEKELFPLTWESVDLNNNTVHVVSAEKGGLRERYIPIHPKLREHLLAWYQEDGGKGHLIKYRGKPVSSILWAWNETKRRAKITRRLRPYDLRHRFATEMLAAGGDLKATSELLGHASPVQTIKTYQHVSKTLHEQNIAKLPDID